jgi:hypothetical protein
MRPTKTTISVTRRRKTCNQQSAFYNPIKHSSMSTTGEYIREGMLGLPNG